METRRTWLRSASGLLAAGGGWWVGGAWAGPAARRPSEMELPPTEDLMREHGVLDRILLVYEEAMRRFDAQKEMPAELLARAAGIVRAFIEDYHEKNEEELVFPRLEKAGRLTELVGILRTQHRAARPLTSEILDRAAAGLKTPDDRGRAGAAMRLFIRMYRPHAAREDTVLFPAFRALVGEKELRRIGAAMEEKEEALARDFEKTVGDVAAIEAALGIGDLAKLTP